MPVWATRNRNGNVEYWEIKGRKKPVMVRGDWKHPDHPNSPKRFMPPFLVLLASHAWLMGAPVPGDEPMKVRKP